MIKRKQYLKIFNQLLDEKSMVFLAGPRQVGKTTFTSETAKQYTNKMYFNYDIVANKKTLIEKPTFFEEINRKDNSKPFIILDEIHTVYSWNESGYGKFSLHFIKNKARLCVNYKQFVKSKLLTYLPDPLF